MSKKFTVEENKALAEFEAAREEWDRGCIGTTRKENNAKHLWSCWEKLHALKLADALIPAERNSALTAGKYLGKE
jgi:hypothetical protein